MAVDAERIERNKKVMTDKSLDVFICRLPENVLFFSGWWPLTGTSWAIFTTDGNCHLIVPECESQEAQDNGITDLSSYEWAHIKAPEPLGQIQNEISKIANKFGFEKSRIGIEEGFEAVAPSLNVGESVVPAVMSKQMLKEALPSADLVDATEVINGLRVLKTSAEIEKLRIANEIAGFGLAVFKENIREGISEIELAAKVNAAIAVNGSDYKGIRSARGFAQISSGKETARGWRPCEITTNRKLQKGDIVLLELGAVADGFWADNTRLAVVGQPNDKQKEIHKLILAAQQAALDTIKPGIKMGTVDKVARDIICDAGYGDYFIHITGHGIGWRYHEFPPLLAPGNETALKEGMVTSVEPGIYMPGFGGMRIEDIVAVNKDGVDILSKFNRKLG